MLGIESANLRASRRAFGGLLRRGSKSVRENACRPTGLAHLVHFTRHFPAGLSHPAATRLESWWCLLPRLRSMVVLTQSLEAAPFLNGARALGISFDHCAGANFRVRVDSTETGRPFMV